MESGAWRGAGSGPGRSGVIGPGRVGGRLTGWS
jgi:hypothetical protein